MLRIYFNHPNGDWSKAVGNYIRWCSFVGHIPIHGHNYEIVDIPDNSDLIIDLDMDYSRNGGSANIVELRNTNKSRKFVWDSADNPTGHMNGFYCSLPRSLFDSRRHRILSYPGPYNNLIEEFSIEDAVLDFSFVGRMTSGVRERIIERFRSREMEYNAIIRETGDFDWHGSVGCKIDNIDQRAKFEFVNLLRSSKFILCPRGYGAGSFRMFEAMQAGRVPVIISDSYVTPSGIDWDSCSLTISENKISYIPDIIGKNIDNWSKMAKNARKIWEDNFSPQCVVQNLVNHYIEIYNNDIDIFYSPWRHSLKVIGVTMANRIRPYLGRVAAFLR